MFRERESVNADSDSTPQVAAALSAGLRTIVMHRGVQATVFFWVVGYLLVFWMASGSLPFDRPAVAALPFSLQLAAPSITLIEILGLMGLVFLLTRGRVGTCA
jgi:hypothetical protein